MKKFAILMILAVLWAIPAVADDSTPLSIEKFVGYEGAWFTADSAPGVSVPVGQTVAYRLVVSNNSETDTLTQLTLTDSLYPLVDCQVPTELAAGQTFECVVGPIVVEAVGASVNVALVTALGADGDILTATDSAVLTSTAAEGVIVVITGAIESIDVNLVVIGGVSYIIPDGNLILPLLEVGDSVVIVAVQAVDGTLTVFLVTLADEDVYIDTDGDDENDDDFRDDAPCQNGPPDWAPAYGWRMKCDPDSLANFVLPPGQAKKLGRDNDDDGYLDTEADENPGRGNGRDKKDKKDKGNNGNGNDNGNDNGNGNGNGKGNGKKNK